MSAQRNDGAVTRREILRQGVLGAAGLAMADRMAPRGWSAPALPVRPAKAKAMIQIWMWGGPCHIDTFDPKPDAGRDYCGALDKAIETNVSGIRIGASLPLLAKQADKYTILRGMTHGNNGHETASYLVQTGRQPGEKIVYPSVGAVVGLFKGYDYGYKGIVPPYVILTKAQGRFSESGFMGSKYKPFVTGGDPGKDPFAVEGIVAQGISDQRQLARRDLLHNLDSLGRAVSDNDSFKKLDECEEKAYQMMMGEARQLFDLTKEPDELRDRYGRNTFGQSCLMARRLVEAGVRYVTINYQGWDTHKQHFESMTRKLPELDSGFATLLEDLSQRGLLDSTIVWWGGEFGRTPKILWEPPWNGGRSHFGAVFSTVVAGGGFKGGQVVGASDAKGMTVADRPVYPNDIIGSFYELLGVDRDAPLPHPQNLDVRVVAADSNAKSGGLLKEIM